MSQTIPFVREGLASKSLYFSIEDVQSRMQIQRPDALDLRYTRTMMGFLLFEPAPREILMVGLGGGSLAKFCFRHLPKTKVEVVEVNPHVIALRRQFCIPEDGERFVVTQADAARFLAASTARYDVLMLDGFDRGGLPPGLSTQRFYDDCFDALRPGGVVVSNFHSAARDFDACVDRLERSFGGGALVVDDREAGNSVVFAAKGRVLSWPAGLRPRCPRGLDARAWSQLSGACERIATACATARSEAGALDGR